MNKPNFFIVGAPKCGTTSWARWLSEHENVFFSKPKELFYFCGGRRNNIRTIEDYEIYFKKAHDAHIAVGEGSTSYLSSESAIKKILAYQRKAKFIVCVRNPVDMAYSRYSMLRNWVLYEDQDDFQTAWNLQEERAKGRHIPSLCDNPDKLQYGKNCSIGKQIEQFLSLVDKDKVHFIVLDDVKENPRYEYLRILEFLNLPDDGREDFPVANSAKALRSKKLKMIIRKLHYIKMKLGFRYPTGLSVYVKKYNKIPIQKKTMPSEFREELTRYFTDDILLLSQLLDRDLSVWLNNER